MAPSRRPNPAAGQSAKLILFTYLYLIRHSNHDRQDANVIRSFSTGHPQLCPQHNCGKKMASPARFELATYRFVPLRLSPPDDLFGVWTFPSPVGAGALRCCPSSLYTFPIIWAWLGIATIFHAEGSPNLSRFTQTVSTVWCPGTFRRRLLYPS